jgi:alpha-amylase/alpha-mannosidase (GH57 family)
MNRYICIHGHFYQPPRENPWLEEVELQESAYPYHDWNERVTAECYAPNTASRILNAERKIVDIVNNYLRMSFNFGPSLLSWMERRDPQTYQAIIESDLLSRKNFQGHGSALAQCYSHMIMPLASVRDKRTQVIWGIRDFQRRFGRDPEGMWLPETAVDSQTLDILAEQGIKFTILAPRQAKRIRKKGSAEWLDVSGSRIDPRRPYLYLLPSGRSIVLFFYDGPVSQGIAFEGLLSNGEEFARRLMGVFSHKAEGDDAELVHIATDGETYGHHHKMGDMALSYCLDSIQRNKLVKITVYGEYLEHHPPGQEVEIFENSSWSCIHGVERWRDNCGCDSGTHPEWQQEWRRPLRDALDWLRENLSQVFADHLAPLIKDPWQARDEYIEVILDRSPGKIESFFSRHAVKELTAKDRVKILKLMEMQRHAMLMYTSCGWFFDEVSGIETVQIIQYAARAIQLAQEVSSLSLEKTFVNLLERAPSNISSRRNGGYIYETLVKPSVLNLLRVGAHYAVSSLFEEYAQTTPLFSYTVTNQVYDRMEVGKQKFAVGKARIMSNITWEDQTICFAVLHLGDHNLTGGVCEFRDEKEFHQKQNELKEVFRKSDIPRIIRLIEKHFDSGQYSLWHLFKDEQTKILYQILDSTLEDVEVSLRQINEHHYPIIQVIKQLKIPLPKVLANTVLLMLNKDILQVLDQDSPDFVKLEKLVQEVLEWDLEVDKATIGFLVSRKVGHMMAGLKQNPSGVKPLAVIEGMLRILQPLKLELNLWPVQNSYFSLGKLHYWPMKARAEKGEDVAQAWLSLFNRLGDYLKVKVA